MTNIHNIFFVMVWLFMIATSYATNSTDSSSLFSHYQFDCDPNLEAYETEFMFLQGLGHGFVHAEADRIFFEYYFPAEHWVAFATADQTIVGEKDECSYCYFVNYYPLSATNKNHSNLYPRCIEECLNDTIFVASVNSDEENINDWSIIEFQISSQISKSLQKKMYRIPPTKEILEIWGSQSYPYRENAHFSTEMVEINVDQQLKQFVHARFWRDYDYRDNNNEWKPFVNGPYQTPEKPDSFCFLSVASFYGGEYPYAADALNGMLPGFYIDTQHFANIHCFKTNDIKVDCGAEGLENEDYDAIDIHFDTTKIADMEITDDEVNQVTQNTTLGTNGKKNDNPYIKTNDFTMINFQTEWCTQQYGTFDDPLVVVNYECVLETILKTVGVIVIVILCVCFCCMRKSRQTSRNLLDTFEHDEFNEGVVDDDTSTLVTIGLQT